MESQIRQALAAPAVVDAGVDQLEMIGLNVVRHYLQQAADAAEFLPGGAMDPAVAANALGAGAALDPLEAAEQIRSAIAEATRALDDEEGVAT